MSSARYTERIRLRPVGVILVALVALGLSACSSSSKTADTTTTSVPSVASTTVSTPATDSSGSGSPPAAALAAVSKYELAHGPGAGKWVVSALQASSIDPSYVYFRITPAATATNVQPGYGFVRKQSTGWSVIAYGSDQVGCPPGAPGNEVVPAKVVTAFFLTCAPSG